MKPGAAIEVTETLSENQRAALINLLADENPAVYQAVREKLLSCGPCAADWLRRHTLSRDAALRRRAQEIVLHFDRQAADNVFTAFCLKHGEDCDLEAGAWLLAQTEYPEINVGAYRALLDNFAGDLRERLEPGTEARAQLTVLNQYLFKQLGFSGNEENYFNPENSYLNRVLDRRTGNPINLCLLYLLLARRLHLPVAGIGLPGHFICRYQSSAAELYIDVFERGKFLTKADCIQYLIRANFNIREEHLSPVSPRRLLFRICANLHQIYLQLELSEQATRLQRYQVALGH
jgi:regulator of sirC expression with transglutaminase-like and TPR domain